MFEPDRWPDDLAQVSLDIPVCKLILCWVVDGIIQVAYVPTNTNSPRTAVRRACKEAIAKQALLWFACDTARQANLAARLAARWLPNYEGRRWSVCTKLRAENGANCHESSTTTVR